MVNHSIKVYARLKYLEKNDKEVTYEIVKEDKNFDDIILYNNFSGQGISNASSFRFHKVFDQRSKQEDVFDTVAKPVINSVLQGFNGTIFAYGQTGSGKTYSITGSPKNYNDRGIIPRTIQYVFSQNEKVTTKPTVYISYMEIYNEIGYDLLNSRHDNTARSLEELTRIVLLEDSHGEVNIRNMNVLPVSTEQEAMRLLFLGDTNRTIAETPMNEYSSRSHCIFTIYITFRDESTNVLRYSKLHLVDLAGSERVYKSLTTGTALREAKHINLSLHYLQQVILALSESKRLHIPYRNSMMTYILKDSLSGNCLTAMLATLALNKDNIQETICTCRFAQRVSMITTAPVINEIRDPQKEIVFLKNKVEELRRQLSLLSGITCDSLLDKNLKEEYKKEVEKYLATPKEELSVQPSMPHIQFCFRLLKDKINLQNLEKKESQLNCTRSQEELVALKETLEKQDGEINLDNLKKIIDEFPENPMDSKRFLHRNNNVCNQEIGSITNSNKTVMTNYLPKEQNQYFKDQQHYNNNLAKFNAYATELQPEIEKQLFEEFIKNPNNAKDIEYFTQNLQKKLEMAKIYADTIEQCQKNITYIRQKLQTRSNNTIKNKLLIELEEQQKIYSKSLDELKTVKNETFHLQSGLKKAEIKMMRKFKDYMEAQHSLESSKTSFSGTDSKSSACSTELGCYTYGNSKEKICRNSTNQCSCGTEVEKKRSVGCCNSVVFQRPTNCWTNCWAGNVCLGPICQPVVVDQSQYNDHSVCSYRSHVHRSNSRMCDSEMKHRMQCQSEYSFNPGSVSGHSYSFGPVSRSVSLDQVEEEEDRSYCCREMNSEHQSFLNRNLNNGSHSSESFEKKLCCENSDESVTESLSTSEECMYPYLISCTVGTPNYQHTEKDQIHSEEKETANNFGVGPNSTDLFKETDSIDFREFMKTVSLSGDIEIDKEIFNFYRNKFYS